MMTARTCVELLHALHGHCDGVTEFRTFKPGDSGPPSGRAFLKSGDVNSLTFFIGSHLREHAYFGVATRRDGSGGTLENCAQLPALFVDLDFKLTPEPSARQRLVECPFAPSAIVSSGNGLHAYWLLAEPLDLQDHADQIRAAALLRRLAHFLDADRAAAEPARVLRVPGSSNFKYDPPRQVRVELLEPERRYHLSEFDDLLPAEPITENSPSFVAPEKIGDGERNGTLFKEARSLKAKNFSREAIRGALHAENRAKCEPPLPDSEIEAIVESAWTQADRPEFTPRPLATEPTRKVDDLELDETAGLYTVRSATHGAILTFDRLQEQRGSYSAELTVMHGSTIILDPVKISLQSDTAQVKHASSLKLSTESVPWKMLLQKACALVMRQKRLGRPSVLISKDSQVTPLTYALNPLVFKKKATILYGDGGLGKSTLGLLCAMLVSTGQQLAGLGALKGRALFLDWEDDEDVHIRRYHAIVAGHPSLAEARMDYQECDEPLPRMLHTLIRRIQADKITFVVVDSLLAANSGDASAEGVSKLFDAIHLLRVECLLLGHVPKAPLEGQQEQSVYGSVFNKNRARSTWEIKKQQEIGEDVAILGLFHRKSNHSRQHPPLGLKVTQTEHTTSILYEPFDLSQAIELVTALPMANQIRNLLEDGEPRSSREIAEELGITKKLGSVKATLSNPKYKGLKWHMLGENKDAKWTVWNR